MLATRLSLLTMLALVFAACGGSDETYYLPADSQIKPFVAPEADDIAGEGDADAEDEGDADEEAADEGGETPPPAKGAPASPGKATPPAKGSAAPAKGGAPAKPSPNSGVRTTSGTGSP